LTLDESPNGKVVVRRVFFVLGPFATFEINAAQCTMHFDMKAESRHSLRMQGRSGDFPKTDIQAVMGAKANTGIWR